MDPSSLTNGARARAWIKDLGPTTVLALLFAWGWIFELPAAMREMAQTQAHALEKLGDQFKTFDDRLFALIQEARKQ